MPITRVYVETSVLGGVFDEEFQDASVAFFDEIRSRRFQFVTSSVVQEELALAPQKVREFLAEIVEDAEIVDVHEEALQLRAAYLDAKIVSQKWSTDALHVAMATVSGCSLIVSWNFRHIVHFQKIPLYNAVNTLKGYNQISIFSPLEVLQYEEDEDL